MAYKVHTDPTCNSLALFDTLEAALQAKGLDPQKVIRAAKARSSFSYRARTDRTKCFNGFADTYGRIVTEKSLEFFVAANDIAGYVTTWRKLNNLKA